MSEKKPLKRIITLVSAVAFLGSTGFAVAGLFSNALQEPEKSAPTNVGSADQQLQAKERGYELVLEREPENQVALQGLVETRLQMNNLQGAVEPMAKLVKLNPNNPQYKALLAGIKERVSKGDKVGDITETSTEKSKNTTK
jgi:cytochrome c-type biogenesis protein CcmH/NrfG